MTPVLGDHQVTTGPAWRTALAVATLVIVAVGPRLSWTGEPAADRLTVDGPEASQLVDQVRGTIITDDTGNITAIALPGLQRSDVRVLPHTEEGLGPTVHALSGPDRDGRIAYVEDHFFVANETKRRHLLKTVRIDGTCDTEIFSRPGSAMWATTPAGQGEIGTHVSLAPSGGLAALLGKVTDKQMPGALLHLGRLEIWNVVTKSRDDTQMIALDEPVSWFPEGRRFAYARLVPRKQLPRGTPGLEHFGSYFGFEWDEVPAIYLFDLDRRERTFFYVGWRAVVSADGQAVFVGGWEREDFSWRRVEFTTGESSPVSLPGIAGDILAAPAKDLIIYWGLPTAGAPMQKTEANSPLRGAPSMLTIKVAHRNGSAFQTIVPSDPRSHASYGTWQDSR